MTLRDKAQEILNLYNYYTGAIITDKEGTIIYYYNRMKDVNSLEADESTGKACFNLYPA